MQGDQIGSIDCTTVNKMLAADGALPKFEVSAQGGGQLCGVDVTSMATYWAQMRSDGSLYGECPNAGVVMTADGIATFRATGTGSFTDDGGSKFRGVCYFETAAASLSSLNGMCVVYSWDVDASGNASWKLWEWKQRFAPKQISRCD